MGCWVSGFLVLAMLINNGEMKRSNGEQCHQNDLKGLRDFKAGIDFDTSGRLKKWLGRSCCTWEGITCNNSTGRVIEINLPGFETVDDVPLQTSMRGLLSPSITRLSYLEVINLGGLNGLTGQIPPSIGVHLPMLRKIDIFGNSLHGSLPESIGKLSKLEEMYLYENNFSGSLPSSIGDLTTLKRLDLHSNRLSGVVPESITNLKDLESLTLQNNLLTGNIPGNIGNLRSIRELDLSNNSLSGKIPPSISRLDSISVIYLDTNQLEGEIPFPSSSSQMSSLSFLRLNNNRLSGKIPPSFGDLISLQRVSLANNRLQGPLPSTMGNLTSLTELYLGGNWLSGQIPESIGRISQLLMFSIPNNKIQGPLPQMSSLVNLQKLDLSFNRLNLSSVPNWIFELPSLSKIYLAGCGIHGEFPEHIRSASGSLQELDLSSNYLSGAMPAWLGSLAQLYMLNLSVNSLVSVLPSTISNLENLGVLDLHSNKLQGSINPVFQIRSRFEDGSLTNIDLSQNRFTSGTEGLGMGTQQGIMHINCSHNFLSGKIPTSIRELVSIHSLDLSYNELGSSLPASIGNLSSLERLKLQNNRFTGRIPNEFLKLKELKDLDLSHNYLVGKIPFGKPLLDFPERAYSGNRALCGRPLNPCGNGTNSSTDFLKQ